MIKYDYITEAGHTVSFDTLTGVSSDDVKRLDHLIDDIGMAAVLGLLAGLCDTRAEHSTENFNTVQAKRWARCAVDLEAAAEQLKKPVRT